MSMLIMSCLACDRLVIGLLETMLKVSVTMTSKWYVIIGVYATTSYEYTSFYFGYLE